jgi:hypothetical protein
MPNIKGMYYEKTLDEDTNMSVVNIRRPDDGNWALAMRFNIGGKILTCFVEDIEGVSFAGELGEALLEYAADAKAVQDAEDERRAKEHEALKNTTAKK